jgi:hypothetical protein
MRKVYAAYMDDADPTVVRRRGWDHEPDAGPPPDFPLRLVMFLLPALPVLVIIAVGFALASR